MNATADLHSSDDPSTEHRIEKLYIVLEELLCRSRSLWWRMLQDRVSQNNTRPARPRPRLQLARQRLIFLVSGWSCPKTNGVRPHQWSVLCPRFQCLGTADSWHRILHWLDVLSVTHPMLSMHFYEGILIIIMDCRNIFWFSPPVPLILSKLPFCWQSAQTTKHTDWIAAM